MCSMAKILAQAMCRGFENEAKFKDISESEKVPNFLTMLDDVVFEHLNCFSVSLETAKIMLCHEIIELSDNYDIREMALSSIRQLSEKQGV